MSMSAVFTPILNITPPPPIDPNRNKQLNNAFSHKTDNILKKKTDFRIGGNTVFFIYKQKENKMKNTTKRKLGQVLSGVLAVAQVVVPAGLVVAGVAAIAACKEPDNTPARESDKVEFGTGLYTMVDSSALTDAQWKSVKTKLQKALDNASKDAEVSGICASIFGGLGFNINILATTSGYSYYKLDGPAKKIFLNASYVIGATDTDLSAKIKAAIKGDVLQAKVIDNSKETVRMAFAAVNSRQHG
jgi:hypothetical protein